MGNGESGVAGGRPGRGHRRIGVQGQVSVVTETWFGRQWRTTDAAAQPLELFALLALTPNRPEFQPGFADVGTSVQAAAPFFVLQGTHGSLIFVQERVFVRRLGAADAAR